MRPTTGDSIKPWLLAAALAAASSLLLLCWLGGEAAQPLPEDVSVALRGHFEGAMTADGQVVPLFLGLNEQFYLCLQAPPARDTSHWEARLFLGQGGGETEFLQPDIRMEATLCFKAPSLQQAPVPGKELFCGQLRDTYDGALYQLPCQPVQLSDQGQAYWNLNQQIYAQAGSPLDEGLQGWLDRLKSLTAQARERGFLFLAQHGRLIAANRLRLQGEEWALQKADQLLRAPARWIKSEAALELAGETAFEQSELDFQTGLLESAWQGLSRADQAYLKLAHPFRLPVIMRQAEIQSRMGSAGEAVLRLEGGLEHCGKYPSHCDPTLISYAENHLAWLSLLDPDSDRLALSRAGDLLEKALAGQQNRQGQQAWVDPLEPANILINLAYQRLQSGRNPAQPLQQALSILDEQPSEMYEVDLLRDWASLIKALFRLATGRASDALKLCRQLSGRQSNPLLASWAYSCSGRAQVQLTRLAEAADSFQRAILIHQNSSPQEIGRGLPLGPGQRADDYYRLARVLLDRGDPAGAWERLSALDRLAESERERIRCREQAVRPQDQLQWRQNEERRRQLLAALIDTDVPASRPRQTQLGPIHQALMLELQDISRNWPGCSRRQGRPKGPPADYRALALEDEILLLRRLPDGEVALDRRTPLQRRQGRRWVWQLKQRQRQGAVVTEAEWRKLLAPLSKALLPSLRAGLGEVTIFSLHGWLQDVPLSALPLEGSEGGWLSDLTTVALRPAGLSQAVLATDLPAPKSPLFVVDPQGDLRGGRQLLETYSRLFPKGRILQGEQATGPALRQSLPQAPFLHVDAHGLYNPAFADLSRLQMSDGPLTLLELSELPAPRRFVNLSGCHTGRWPVTADSGRYGMAGVFARSGASWVIASRSDLDDRLARDFNRIFYQSIAAGRTVPQAFQAALKEVRSHHPPSAWSSLMLIRGAGR